MRIETRDDNPRHFMIYHKHKWVRGERKRGGEEGVLRLAPF